MKKKNILIISGSRADYYLLSNVKRELDGYKNLRLKLLVTGGASKLKLNNSNKKKYFEKIDIPLKINKDKKITTPKAISEIINKLSNYLYNKNTDLVILLGDRYEIFGAAIVAHSLGIKIAHFHGGETTLGSKDDDYRNAITQLSDYHFVTCKEHKEKVKNIKNINTNIFIVGSIGVDSIKKNSFIKKSQIEKKLKLKLQKKISLVTIHPETKNMIYSSDISNLFSVIRNFPQIDFIFTYPGYDFGFRDIINRINNKKKYNNVHIFENLGQNLYHSLMFHCSFVLGNSSSGILEAPSFKKYTINLGSRQKGRVHAKSVLHADFKKNSIKNLIKKVINMKSHGNIFKNPHEKSDSIKKSAKIIKNLLNDKQR